MKYLVLILVVLLVLWLLRGRLRPRANDIEATSRPAAAQKMVHCGHCGVHLPRAEALAWGDRFFCDETHRLAEEVKEAKP